jgi:hypothetical protein
MLLLALLPPMIGFLAAGCMAFFLCAAIAPLRRFALGISLWLAIWSVLVPAAFFPNIYLLGLLSLVHIHDTVPINEIALHHVKTLALINGIFIAILATTASALHGWLMRRTTLALFHIYITAVTLGVTFLFTWLVFVVTLVVAGDKLLFATACALPCLVLSGVSLFAWRHPSGFRAARPQKLQPITPAEYDTIPLCTLPSNE